MKTANNNYSKFYLLVVLVSTLSFSQEAKKITETTLKNNSNSTNKSANTNPYFVSNQMEGNMASISISGKSNEPKNSVSNVLKTKHDTAKNSVGNIR